MNIELQSCALAMLLMLLFIFSMEKSLNITSRRLFFWTLISAIACLCLDILSIAGIYGAEHSSLPGWVAQFLCKFYIASLILQAYLGLRYSAGELFITRSHRALRWGSRIWLTVGSLAAWLLPVQYVLKGRVVYSCGPAAIAGYVTSSPFVVLSVAMAFRGTERIAPRRRRCILLWQGSWLAAAVIQFIRPDLLLLGFAVALGMMLIYAELENPHEGVDRTTGQFTANALLNYLEDLYQHRRPFAAMHMKVEFRSRNVDPETSRAVLLHISNCLNLDRDAYVFRESDDEFAVIYPDRARMEAARSRVSGALQETEDFPARLRYILVPDGLMMNSAEEYLRMYHYVDKQAQGQRCTTVDENVVSGMRDYLRTCEMVREALQEERVEVFYQPIYNVAQRRFTAAEALVRIRDKDGGLIPPGRFIPVAEETGLIVPLGFEIFRQVCAFLSTGRAQSLGLEYVEVNLSIAQFDSDNPARFVRETMQHYHICPQWINLEITETASSSEKQVIQMNMNKLLDMGISFSLDDFGTGRSNLDYFVEMPVDFIKFDSSFTQGYFRSEKARCVLESVAGMMKRMRLPIVAEGVETEKQLTTMCDLGVSYIQGFYFSRPVPQSAFLDFLEAQNVKAG